MNYEPALTPGQAAKLFNVSVPGIHTWIEKGLLHAWRTPGGHRRISRKSVDALLRQRDGVEPPREEDNPFVILVIDDDHQLLQLYKMLMAKWKFPLQLFTAESGMDGLIQIAKKRPDLIIVDPDVPDLDGFQMIRKLKNDPELRRMRIVTVSSYDPSEIERHGDIPQDVQHLQKPVPFAHLEKIVGESVGVSKGRPRVAD